MQLELIVPVLKESNSLISQLSCIQLILGRDRDNGDYLLVSLLNASQDSIYVVSNVDVKSISLYRHHIIKVHFLASLYSLLQHLTYSYLSGLELEGMADPPLSILRRDQII